MLLQNRVVVSVSDMQAFYFEGGSLPLVFIVVSSYGGFDSYDVEVCFLVARK